MMPIPVKFAQQRGVAEIAPDLPARLKLDKRFGHHRIEQGDKANGTNQQTSRET
jgi:hypothetical protein